MGGLISSSYWPDFTFHKKASKKMPAIEILAISRIIMTLIFNYYGSKVKLVMWTVFDTSQLKR